MLVYLDNGRFSLEVGLDVFVGDGKGKECFRIDVRSIGWGGDWESVGGVFCFKNV